MKNTSLLFTFILTLITPIFSQHTFSIVAIDSVSGQIGSAGATCGDSIIWPGTPGAYIISDIIPGIGAIHTQSFYLADNQSAANAKMDEGLSPDEIINWLVNNDVQGNPSQRQYGIVDYNFGSPRSAAFTGANCFDYKNHILGPNYAIQGNILLGQEILDDMEDNFLNTNGSLAEKLMASMQGANIIGADTRCLDENTSSLSAFLRVANPDDNPDDLFLDINVAGTLDEVEPIDVLQEKFDQWLISSINGIEENIILDIIPNPASTSLSIYHSPFSKDCLVKLISLDGRLILIQSLSNEKTELDIQFLDPGLYIIEVYLSGKKHVKRIIIK